ncbi:von Willebrand factor D and EGF domain-containing protein-like [Mytilus edulis]|uniref:von Willebrand factor D and EGF domain-containing protein-like n=1 Tax=Mytilus edulis TaxID=6550 RepID=UPI0039F0A754
MKTCRSTKILKSVYTTSCKNRVYFSKRSVGRGITKSTDETEEDDDKPTMYPMTSDSNVDESNQIESDWSNGWTNDTARQFCTDSIYNAPAFGPCSQYVPFMDPEAYIENCILDIKYEGNSTWIKSTLEGFADVCLEKAQKLENLTKTNDTTSLGVEKSIFDLISESTCADNCSGHGQCLEGVCNCTTGYFGSSCSSDASQPPLLIRNAFEGECDTAKKPCKKFIIPGSNFIDDGNLTCRFESFRILKNTSSSTVVWDETFMYPGKFRSSFFMNCELPETRRKRSTDDQKNVEGYDVSVSNNGSVFTEPLTIIVFDSSCFKCNLTELQCDELDTCPGLKEEPTTPTDSISIFLVISLAISISIIMLIVGLLCLKKKIRTRQQEPYVGDMKTMTKNSI